jgi:hypothetical protein
VQIRGVHASIDGPYAQFVGGSVVEPVLDTSAGEEHRVAGNPRKGSVAICSRCHLPAPGYDQLGERRFEFIPLFGFLVFLLYTMCLVFWVLKMRGHA